MKQYKITVTINEIDELQDLIAELNITTETAQKYISDDGIAVLELKINQQLEIVGGKFLPRKKS